MSPEPVAELAGCACAAAGTAAARVPAASMPCRKPRRSFVLESIVVLALLSAMISHHRLPALGCRGCRIADYEDIITDCRRVRPGLAACRGRGANTSA